MQFIKENYEQALSGGVFGLGWLFGRVGLDIFVVVFVT